MVKFHINDKGNPGKCNAQQSNCPFGPDAPHFETKQEAQKYYEESHSNVFSHPVVKAKIYRVGTLETPEEYFDDLNTFLQDMDKFKPEGRQGRYKGLFASPDMESHGRWVRGMEYNKHEGALDSYEITVDENSVYVYNVRDYEKASSIQNMYGSDSEKFKEAAEKFWNTGMTLSEWKKWAKDNNPERGTWEIIMSQESIVSSKKLSNRTIIENMSDIDSSEVNRILEPQRSRKGLIWRKNTLNEESLKRIKEKAIEDGLKLIFVNDLEQIYSKNAYKTSDFYSAEKEIYSAIQRIQKKRGEEAKPFSSLTETEKKEFRTNVLKYLAIIENDALQDM